MTTSRIFLFTLLLAAAVLLSACSGGVGVATSWPGLSVDAERGAAYVAAGQFVYGVDLSNGRELWRFPAEADNKISMYASPVLTEDGQLLVGAYNNLLYSLDPETGQPVNSGSWPFAGSSNRYIESPLVAGTDRVYAPSSDQNLYALTSEGVQRWAFRSDQSLWSTPATNGELIFQPSMDHYVYALDTDGNLVWQSESLAGAMVGEPALNDTGSLYIGNFGRQMVALDTSDGSVQWVFPTEGWVWSGPALVNGVLYFGDLNGYVYAVDATSGEEVWRIAPAPDASQVWKVTGTPLVVNDVVYYGSENGNLYAVDAANGDPIWNQATGGEVLSAPQLVGDLIVVALNGADTPLVAYDANGVQRWTFTPEEQ